VLQTRRRDYNSVDHPPPSAERMMVAIEHAAENAGERTAFALPKIVSVGRQPDVAQNST
jgi:hypothetical protein